MVSAKAVPTDPRNSTAATDSTVGASSQGCSMTRARGHSMTAAHESRLAARTIGEDGGRRAVMRSARAKLADAANATKAPPIEDPLPASAPGPPAPGLRRIRVTGREANDNWNDRTPDHD